MLYLYICSELDRAITLAATLSGHFNYVTSIVYIIAQVSCHSCHHAVMVWPDYSECSHMGQTTTLLTWAARFRSCDCCMQIVGAAIGAMLQVALVPGIHW